MLWYQGVHNIGLSNHKLSRVRAEVGSPLFEQAAGGAKDPLAGR